MPNNVVNTDKDEEKWEKAKAIAENEDKGDNHAYIMSLYKKMDPSHDFEKESQLPPFSARGHAVHEHGDGQLMTPYEEGYNSFMKLAMRLPVGIMDALSQAARSRPGRASLLPAILQETMRHPKLKHQITPELLQMVKDRDAMNRLGGLGVGALGTGAAMSAMADDE